MIRNSTSSPLINGLMSCGLVLTNPRGVYRLGYHRLIPTGLLVCGNPMVFQTTHWSEVLAAREQDGTAGEEALANLCSAYWYPLYAFIRREGFDQHEAED